jgi:hypothetical protein
MSDTLIDALTQIPVEQKQAHAKEEEPNTLTNYVSGVRPVKAEVISHPEDTSRMEVAFILASTVPYQVFSFATRPELIEFGLRLVTREGLERPGYDNYTPPMPCDENGKLLDPSYLQATVENVSNPESKPESEAEKLHYYKVVYNYLGEN